MDPYVFISHSLQDHGIAEQARHFLEENGLRCLLPDRKDTAETELDERVSRTIQECAFVVLIFSQSANESAAVCRELECAVKSGKVLIPFRIENVSPTGAIEAYFRRRYWHEAHIPPLEEHLKELVRVLKPLMHKPKMKISDDPSISRTLPSRSSIIRRSDGNKPAVRESDGPLRISFNFDHILLSGYTSTFEVSLENRGSATLNRIEVLLESRGLQRNPVDVFTELAPDTTQRRLLELETPRAGDYPLRVTVTYHDGSRQFAFVGSRILHVDEAPAASSFDPEKGKAPAMAELAPPLGEGSDLGQLMATQRFSSLEELLKFTRPESFEPLDLDRYHDVGLDSLELAGIHRALRIPEGALAKARLASVLKLEPLEASNGIPHQEIRLVGRPSFSLGRLREDVDFLLLFWPRNEVHDTKTRRISKKHGTLTVENGRILICNTASASLTKFDGQDVSAEKGLPLERQGLLDLSGIYLLEITLFPSSTSNGPRVSNPEALNALPAESSAFSSGGSVRFAPMTPHVLPQNSTWLLSDGTFGTSRANPINLPIAGLGEIQGRLHHYRGVFWIENFLPNDAVQVNSEPLEPGVLMPLLGGETVKLGDKSFFVSVSN